MDQRSSGSPSSHAAWLRAAALLVLALSYGFRLGAGSLWDNSEPQYGEIVKEMLRGGDWLTLHKDLHPWFIHPPLWFWATALSAKIFGLTELGLRIPSAAFGLLCGLAAYFAARRLYGEIAGVVAMLALGLSLEVLVMGRLAIQDTMLICFMSVAGFWSFFAVRDGDRRAFWIATGAAVLGTLTKGPVAVVLPFLSLLVWVAWTKRWRALGAMPWLPALAAYVVLAGAWFAAETVVWGPRFLESYFGLSNVGRFMSPFENQPGPLWFYVPYVIAGFFPFIAFVPSAVVRAWRSLGDDGTYLLIAFAVPFVFFSVAQTKLPNYIAVAFPSLAVLTGELFQHAASTAENRRVSRPLWWLTGAVVAVVIGAAIFLRAHPPAAVTPYLSGLALLGETMLAVTVATCVALALTHRPAVAAWGLSVLMMAFIVVIAGAILPQVEATAKPMKAMSADVMRHWRSGDRICFDGVKQGFSFDYYTDGPPVLSVGHNTDDTSPRQFFGDPSPALCVVSPSAFASLAKEGYPMALIEKTPTLWLAARGNP